MARLYAAQGDLDLACQQIDEALRLATRFDLTELDDYVVEVHQARLWIESGELDKVDRWQDRRGMQDRRIFSSQEERAGGLFVRRYLDLLEQLTLVRLLFVRGAYARILEMLPEMAPEAERYSLAGCAVEIQAFRAMAMDALGEREAAFEGLNQAISKAERHGYVRLLIDLGPPMRELLAAYHEMQPADDPLAIYVLELLASFKGVTPTGRQTIVPGFSAETDQVEMLSERESQILRLIAAGYSNREIADELYIAISTVKTHINNIYGKLGVSSRTRAVARARELGIL
jgi:LuxR family maltose regulon positive regulatory protein